MKIGAPIALPALLAASCTGLAPSTDQLAVERALLDYVEAIELAKPALTVRSVHPDLHKFGVFRKSCG
jgi:hypothetical protein